MFLGIFIPLVIVYGFAFLVGIVIVVREFKMLRRAFIETPQTKPKEFSKIFVEKKSSDLISAREGVHKR